MIDSCRVCSITLSLTVHYLTNIILIAKFPLGSVLFLWLPLPTLSAVLPIACNTIHDITQIHDPLVSLTVVYL